MHIAVANLKGGVGKTTTAVHLAAGLARQDGSTVLIDCDPSAQATRWAQLAPDLPYQTVSYPRTGLRDQLASLAGDTRHVVIDTPPLDPAIVASGVGAAGILLVTTEPEFMALDRVQPTIDLLAGFTEARDTTVYVVLTKVRAGTGDAAASRRFLESQGFPVLDTEVPLLVGFHRAYGEVPPDGTRYGQLLDEIRAKEAVPA